MDVEVEVSEVVDGTLDDVGVEDSGCDEVVVEVVVVVPRF